MKGFLFGALVGAGVALLYAPGTGRRTRSLIRDKATKLSNDISDFADKKTRHFSNKVQGLKAQMQGMAEEWKQAVSTEPTFENVGAGQGR